MSVEDTLEERAKTYGDFGGGIALHALIMGAICQRYSSEQHGMDMPEIDKANISMNVMKLTRLSVTPDHIDSWHDIAGYATLVEKELRKNAKSK
mgnify:CR=1 FL=1|jgi:hypothetical protein